MSVVKNKSGDEDNTLKTSLAQIEVRAASNWSTGHLEYWPSEKLEIHIGMNYIFNFSTGMLREYGVQDMALHSARLFS